MTQKTVRLDQSKLITLLVMLSQERERLIESTVSRENHGLTNLAGWSRDRLSEVSAMYDMFSDASAINIVTDND